MAERDFKRLMRARQSSDDIDKQGSGKISSGENTVKVLAGALPGDAEFTQLLQSAGDMSKASYQPGDNMEQDILQKIRVLSSFNQEDSEPALRPERT